MKFKEFLYDVQFFFFFLWWILISIAALSFLIPVSVLHFFFRKKNKINPKWVKSSFIWEAKCFEMMNCIFR